MSIRGKSGFTLVELLVVIAIIGILIALLLPAVQSAREMARRLTCKNHVKQMATACLHHEEAQGFLPTGGWGWGWAGDPDRGFDKSQPGGWHYNILPFLDRVNLYQMGTGGDIVAQGRRVRTAVPTFHCPSRRPAVPYPYYHGSPYNNVDYNPGNYPDIIGRSDYAANGGDGLPPSDANVPRGPGSLADGDAMSNDAWGREPGGWHTNNGVVYTASECQIAHITDGTTSTYLLGERNLTPDRYGDGYECANDQGWDLGYDYDVNRWTAYPPAQDRPGYSGCMTIFGSAHSVSCHMAFCDGSVREISYHINSNVHRYLGNRQDGQAVDLGQF